MARLVGATIIILIIVACLSARLLKAQDGGEEAVTTQEPVIERCLDGDIRLVHDNVTGSPTITEADFVEYCSSEVWRRLCVGDSRWRNPHADLACRQLGYAGRVNQGGGCSLHPTDSFYRLQQTCTPEGDALSECGQDELDECDCMGTINQGWLECQPVDCVNGTVRLVNGSSEREGRIEVCIDGRWGTVCSDFEPEEIAAEACNQLGFNETGSDHIVSPAFGPGVVVRRTCSVNNGVIECVNIFDPDVCDHIFDLGVECLPPPTTELPTEDLTTTTEEQVSTMATTEEQVSTMATTEEQVSTMATTEEQVSSVATTEEETTQQVPTEASTEEELTSPDDNTTANATSSAAVAGLGGAVGVLAAIEAITVAVLIVAGIALKKGKERFRKSTTNIEGGQSQKLVKEAPPRPVKYKRIFKKGKKAETKPAQASNEIAEHSHYYEPVISESSQGKSANQNPGAKSSISTSKPEQQNYSYAYLEGPQAKSALPAGKSQQPGSSNAAQSRAPELDADDNVVGVADEKKQPTYKNVAAQSTGENKQGGEDQPDKEDALKPKERKRQLLGDIGKQDELDRPAGVAIQADGAQRKENEDTLIDEALDLTEELIPAPLLGLPSAEAGESLLGSLKDIPMLELFSGADGSDEDNEEEGIMKFIPDSLEEMANPFAAIFKKQDDD